MAGRVNLLSCLVLGLVMTQVSAFFMPHSPFMFGHPMGFSPFFNPLKFNKGARRSKPLSRTFSPLADVNFNAMGPITLAGGMMVDADVVNGELVYRNHDMRGHNLALQAANALPLQMEYLQLPALVDLSPGGRSLARAGGRSLASPVFSGAQSNLGVGGSIEDSLVIQTAASSASTGGSGGPVIAGAGANSQIGGDINDSILYIDATASGGRSLARAGGRSLASPVFPGAQSNLGVGGSIEDSLVIQRAASSASTGGSGGPMIAGAGANSQIGGDINDSILYIDATASAARNTPAAAQLQII